MEIDRNLGQPVHRATISSLDRTQSIETNYIRPDRYRWLYQALANAPAFVARGQGLAYTLGSAGPNALSISSLQFNRILGFDPEELTIEVEAGMMAADLLHFATSQNLWVPALPGHPKATVGACIAFNVAGKSPFHEGLFGDHVEELAIFHPEHGEIRCSPTDQPEIFELTIGGMGLTGFILRAKLKLQRLKGASIVRKRVSIQNFQELTDAMGEFKEGSHHIYSQHDLNGRNFGSGFLFLEAYAPQTVKKHFYLDGLRSHAPVGWMAKMAASRPHWLFQARQLSQRFHSETATLDLMNGTFSWNGRERYFEICRARGFYVWQAIIPDVCWMSFCDRLQETKKRNALAVTYCGVQIFTGTGKLLHFRQNGMGITLHIPRQSRVAEFMMALDSIMLESGGIPNITQDSRLSVEVINKAYPQAAEFRKRILQFDSQMRVKSILRERLNV